MIDAISIGGFAPLMFAFCGILMVVLRAGASRVFFDVVGTFQANKMLKDTEAAVTMMNAIAVDGLSGIEEAGAMVAEQMQKIVEATVPLSQELEKATLEFQKFVSEENGSRLAKEVREVGLQFGFTGQEALEAGSRMAQLSSIIGENAVPAASEMALAFGLIGDMTPERAMQKLINLQQQTSFIFDNTTKAAYAQLTADEQRLVVRKEMANVLNNLNKVEDNSAATMSKITGVMNEFASQAHLAGEEISMMAAMSATLIEAGEEQGKGGRALRMIYARLGADTGGAASSLNELGIATKNSDGSLRALSDILADLNPHWNQMNSGQKQAVAQMVAGNRHYVRFIKLAENYDRIVQLNTATTQQMGEVFDEAGEPVNFLNDLMESNAIALDKARAELELVNAEMGDFFIPTVISATEFQTHFNQALTDALHATHNLGSETHNLGTVIQGFFTFQQIMSSTFAPFFSAMINVKAMNIALMTQRQIMRALSGAALQKADISRNAHKREAMSMAEERAGIEKIIGLTDAERLAKKVANEEEIANIKEVKIAQDSQIAAIKETISLVGMAQKVDNAYASTHASNKKYGIALEQLFTDEKKYGITITNMSANAVDMAGTSQAALNRHILAARAAQEAYNLQLLEQLGIFELQNAKSERRMQKLMEEIMALKMAEKAQKGVNLTTREGEAVAEAYTMTIMKLSMTFMKVGMAIFAAEMVVMMFKNALPGITTEADAARVAIILMAMGMAVMSAEMILTMSTMVTNAAVMGASTAATTTATVANGILTGSIALSAIAAKAATIAWTAFWSVVSWGGFIAVAIGIAVAINKYILPKLNAMTKGADEAADSMSDLLDVTADYASGIQASMDSLDFGGFDSEVEKLNEFNSRREELFFGFKAGQVTGDLIKQVQQGGVDSFIANTEIIMNNNFNGMTTDEVADEILRQIELKMGGEGVPIFT